MADYKEETIAGQMTQYTRCHNITIQNPRGNDPTSLNARFDEEIVKTLPDGTVITEAGKGITAEFDPSEVIEIRDTTTWEPTGTTLTVGELYVLLASAYWHYALKRDNVE